MKQEPLVSIIILGWNNYQDIINCYQSLLQSTYKNFNVVIVDNKSKEENLNLFIKWLKSSKVNYFLHEIDKVKGDKDRQPNQQLIIIKNNENSGVAGGCNIGYTIALEVSQPEYVLLLNGDTIVKNDFLTKLVLACEKDKKIGSAQSVLIRFDKKMIDSLGIEMKGHQVYDIGGGQGVSLLKKYSRNQEIFGACGAAALYRVKVIEKIGLFDRGLFATFEDFDLAWRIRLEGLKNMLIVDSVVYHRGGISRHKLDHVIFDIRTFYAARNALVMFIRYYPVSLLIVVTSIVRFFIGIISAIKNHKIYDFFAALGGAIQDRRLIVRSKRLYGIRSTWLK